MKKVRTLSVIMVVALLFISCGYSNEDTDKHSHEYIESVTAPTCTERGYTTYTCSDCGDFYLDNYINSKGHNYINHYCDDCNAAKPPETLDDLIFFYEDQMIAHAKLNSAPTLDGEFEVCVLDNLETAQFMQFYTLSPEIKPSDIEKGLFVKYTAFYPDTQDVAYTVFFNYGIQLRKEYEKITVTTLIETPTGSHTETWFLLPLTANKKIYFEFSIITVDE
jgi:hypothetical protein